MRYPICAMYCACLFACLLLLGFGSIKPFSLLAIWGDNRLVLVYAKNAMDGYGFRYVEALGFPGKQDNLFNPSFDFSFLVFLRIVGVFASSVATSYYLMYLVGISTIYAASAYTLRQLGIKHVLCAVAAVCYVASPYLVFRSLLHDFLSLYFAVPLGILLAFRLSNCSGEVRKLFSLGSAISCCVVATSGLYYAFFSCLFIMFQCSATSLSSRRLKPLVNGFAAVTVIFVLVVLTGFRTGLLDILAGRVPMVVRLPYEQMIYGLSLAEGTHVFASIPILKKVFIDYETFVPYIHTTTRLYEWPGAVLTMLILTSPVICAAIAQMEHRTETQRLALTCSLSIVFGLLFSINGGLGFYFNSLIAPSIRAMARIMPFLSFYALIIFCLLANGLLSSPKRSLQFLGVSSLVALFVSILPNVNGIGLKQAQAMDSAETVSNLKSLQEVLATKDRFGLNQILQLPHYSWPEVAPQNGFNPYAMQDYFILDKKGSHTKWSFGGYSNQPSYLMVRDMIEQNKMADLSTAARQMGFDAVLIEKRPISGDDLAMFKKALSKTSCTVYEDERRILLSLSPCK